MRDVRERLSESAQLRAHILTLEWIECRIVINRQRRPQKFYFHQMHDLAQNQKDKIEFYIFAFRFVHGQFLSACNLLFDSVFIDRNIPFFLEYWMNRSTLPLLFVHKIWIKHTSNAMIIMGIAIAAAIDDSVSWFYYYFFFFLFCFWYWSRACVRLRVSAVCVEWSFAHISCPIKTLNN